MKFSKNSSAFTLVEIMIVIAVLLVLTMLAIPYLMRARISANHSCAKSTLKAIGTSLESYAADKQVYPSHASLIIGASPPYLTKNYFEGIHSGYTFSAVINDYDYAITAEPIAESSGLKRFILSTGAVISEEDAF
jgi:type IV pilus assembly protein PilE